jgi:hypothetical protein
MADDNLCWDLDLRKTAVITAVAEELNFTQRIDFDIAWPVASVGIAIAHKLIDAARTRCRAINAGQCSLKIKLGPSPPFDKCRRSYGGHCEQRSSARPGSR